MVSLDHGKGPAPRLSVRRMSSRRQTFPRKEKEPSRTLRTERSTTTQAALNIMPEGCSENRKDYHPGTVPRFGSPVVWHAFRLF